MQMFKKLTEQNWSLFDYAIGLLLLPLNWIFQGVTGLLGWDQVLIYVPQILSIIIYFVSIRRLSRSHPLIRRELKGWGILASLLKRSPVKLNERDRRISEQAYQRAYASLLLVSLLVMFTLLALSMIFPHQQIIIRNDIRFSDAFFIASGFVWLMWALPVTFMAWQIQNDVLID